MNTWGGFVEFDLTDSASATTNKAQMDNGQLAPTACVDIVAETNDPIFANYALQPNGEPSPISHICETIPENDMAANQLANGLISTSYQNSSPAVLPYGSVDMPMMTLSESAGTNELLLLPNLTLQDVLKFDEIQEDGQMEDFGFTEIPLVEVTAAPVDANEQSRQGITNFPHIPVLSHGRHLPGVLNLTPAVYSSASSTATSPDREPVRISRHSSSKRSRSSGPIGMTGYLSSETSPTPKHRSSYQKNSDFETDDSSNGFTSHSDASDWVASDTPMDIDMLEEATSSMGRTNGLELCILRQPESNHRARYRTEGSRGCVKDRTGLLCPTVQLRGMSGNETAILQVFAGSETGSIQPHHLYCVSKAGGKRTAPCRELESGGVHMLKMDFYASENWIVKVDCLGIMKLRNTDIKEPETEITPANAAGKRIKRSRKLRLVFQAVISHADGRITTLCAVSTPLSCTPLPGFPEIHHLSHEEGTVTGGQTIVIIGRNFIKDESKFYIIDKSDGDPERITWEREITLHPEHFQNVHVVGTVPSYHNVYITNPVHVFVVVRNKAKQSEPFNFTYVPSKSQCATATLGPNALPLTSSYAESKVTKIPSEPKVAIPALVQSMPRTVVNIAPQVTRLLSNAIQVSVQPDHNNPPGHIILISVPNHSTVTPMQGSVAAVPVKWNGDVSSKKSLESQNLTLPVQSSAAQVVTTFGQLPEPVTTFEMPLIKELIDPKCCREKSNQQLFDELLHDIMGTQS